MTRQKQDLQTTTKELPHALIAPSLWHLAFNQLNQAIVVKNRNCKVIEANRAFYQLINAEPQEVIGKPFEDVLTPNEKETKKVVQFECKKRKQGIASAYTLRIENSKISKTLRVQPSPILDEKGKFLGSIAIVSEVAREEIKSETDAEALLKAVYNSANIGMCVTNAEGKFVEVNPAYCRTYGYAREELIGQPFTKVLPPELREYAQKLHNDYIAEGTDASAGEWQVQHKNGSIRDISVTAARLILEDGQRFKVTTVTDITERKWIERQLRYQANLLQNVSEAIISLDNEFKITSWNKAAETMYGWKENEVVGKHIHQVFTTRYLNGLTDEQAAEILKTTGEWSGEVVQTKKDGTEMIVQSSVSLLYGAKGNVIGTVAINRDITKQKALERERAELYEQFQQLQKMEAIGTLSGGIAHDFNNILAAILGNATLILEKSTDEKLKRYAERIKAASERGKSLTQQLLGFARRGKLQVAPVDLYKCVKSVTEILENSIDKRIQIRIESIGRIQQVSGDRTQLEQVILNIAVNGVDAIMPTLEEKQSGMLTFSLKVGPPEQRHFLSSQEYVHLAISDSGTGIPKEIQNKIFEPFFTTKEVGKGTGLGLAMVYGIVKNHRGTVYVESEVGKGTTVHVYLPTLMQSEQAQRNKLLMEKNIKNKSASKKILIVDDEEMLRELLSEQLVDAGYGIYEAANGQEAVEMLKQLEAEQVHIDAVLLDMNMPKMGGAKAFAEIRTLFPLMPVLIATGFAQDEVVQKLLESGANGVLSKPYNVEELFEKLGEILKA
ncbi:MAG: PAS domain-containing hybrid sensor histidine kinase/response regulator [Chlorobiales bacterium]